MGVLNRFSVSIVVLVVSTLFTISCGAGSTPRIIGEFYDIDVCSNAALIKAVKKARPADRIHLCDGVWKDLKLTIKNSGTKSWPIIIKAKNPGAVTLSGNTHIELYGSYIDLSGFRWKKYGERSIRRGYIQTKPESHHCKISEMLFEKDNLANFNAWTFNIALQGREHEVFNSAFLGKHGHGAQLIVWEGGENLKHDLHHLYFRREPLGFDGELQMNGGESLQLGMGDGVEIGADDIYAHHLYFENASGESEIISLKGNRHKLTDIVMVGCDGSFSIRGGVGHHIERVVIDGHNKSHAVGMRILGDNHLIRNLFISHIATQWFGGLYFRSGGKNYDVADNVQIENVTLMDVSDAITIGTQKGKLPSGLVFKDIIAVQKKENDRVLFCVREADMYTFTDSFLFGAVNVARPEGAQNLDPALIPMSDGLYIPSFDSVAVGKGSQMLGLPVKKHETGPQSYFYK